MIALDTSLCIIAWNEIATQWLGKIAEDVMGRSFFEVFPEAADINGLKAALDKALNGFKTFLPDTEVMYLKGHYEAHFIPLKDADGKVTGVLQILHDVSHRVKAEGRLKELNRRLARQNAELKHAHEELSSFAKIVSHDLKEPLRKIYVFSELIMVNEAPKLASSGRANFRRIQKSVQRMNLLTDDLVNFTALTSDGEQPDDVDLQALLHEVVLHFQADVARTEAVFIHPPLPVIKGFPAALRQLFTQLLGNMLKFQREGVQPSGCISHQVRFGNEINHEEALPDVEYHYLCFKDNGIGFEPQYKELIFELFQRLHPEGTYRGSGIGLAMARKVVRLHKGFMCAEGVPGEGSTFHCYIPSANPSIHAQ